MELIQEEEAEAKAEAEKTRPGLTMFTDGPRLDDGAAGYSVVWKKGQSWAGIKTHMGYNQEAYDTEFAALARALGSASRRQTAPERVTISTDAQVAIRRMARRSPAYSNSTRFRLESTSLRCGGPDLASPSRRPTNGRKLRRRSQTPAGWNG